MAAPRRLVIAVARRLPGLAAVLEQRDRARNQRDRARAQRDRARAQRDRARSRITDLEQQLVTAQARLEDEVDRRERAETELLRSVRYDRPSFVASLERVQRLRSLTVQEHGVRHPIWEVNAKPAGRRLAVSVGVEVPVLLAGPAGPDELELDLSRPIVVKPVGGSASRGVTPLVPTGAGRAWSVFERQEVDDAQVRAAMRAAAADPRVSDEYLVEELIEAVRPDRALPDDWRCYVVGGRVELLMQRDVRDSARPEEFRFRWYDRDGADFGPVRTDRHDPSLPPPADVATIVEAAERVAAVVPGPFVRIDLFVTDDRVVFCELTPHPGGDQRSSGGLDERLGAAWERAEAGLLVRTYGTAFPG